MYSFSIYLLAGDYRKILKNSWSKHFSITYNEKYNYVFNVTWIGYNLFGTLALGIYLLKVTFLNFPERIHYSLQGDDFEENLLGYTVLALEAVPLFFMIGQFQNHWHHPVNPLGMELFATMVNVPLRSQSLSVPTSSFTTFNLYLAFGI